MTDALIFFYFFGENSYKKQFFSPTAWYCSKTTMVIYFLPFYFSAREVERGRVGMDRVGVNGGRWKVSRCIVLPAFRLFGFCTQQAHSRLLTTYALCHLSLLHTGGLHACQYAIYFYFAFLHISRGNFTLYTQFLFVLCA